MNEVSAPGHDAHDGHDHHLPSGWRRWLYSTNHKDIGTMYLIFALIMFFVGGAMAMVIRLELFQPGLQYVDPQFFNSMTTVHALVMIFGAVMRPSLDSRTSPPRSTMANTGAFFVPRPVYRLPVFGLLPSR